MSFLELDSDRLISWSKGQDVGSEASTAIRDGVTMGVAIYDVVTEHSYEDTDFPAITTDADFINGVAAGIKTSRYAMGRD